MHVAIHAQGYEHNVVTKHSYNVDIPKLHCSNPHFCASSGRLIMWAQARAYRLNMPQVTAGQFERLLTDALEQQERFCLPIINAEFCAVQA